jgi:hypothetical protein
MFIPGDEIIRLGHYCGCQDGSVLQVNRTDPEFNCPKRRVLKNFRKCTNKEYSQSRQSLRLLLFNGHNQLFQDQL